jgi:two-component system phosphate regulon sensor histidine kinase PhoR
MRRTVLLFTLLSFYVIFQFIWWAYLLIGLNDEVYRHKIENVALKTISAQDSEKEIRFFEKKINQRRWMVIGEGGVFIALLMWGSLLMIRAYRQETKLARQQKNFLLSITHEFKSPLAAIKLYMQTLLRHDLDKTKQQSFINSAINDADRLNTLVENALLANLIDHKGYLFSKEDLNFSAFMRLMTQKFQQMPDHETLSVHVEDNVHLFADKNAMNILVNNLLENAWKYSETNKNIAVRLFRENSTVVLEVADQGVGIPAKEKAKIFQKFYRIGNEETRRTKGTGLGLFICKYIVDKHAGKILLKDNQPNGTVVRVEFSKL